MNPNQSAADVQFVVPAFMPEDKTDRYSPWSLSGVRHRCAMARGAVEHGAGRRDDVFAVFFRGKGHAAVTVVHHHQRQIMTN
ncbi:MAG: hypothetical protein GY801_30370 [bacterium]|nr:hypothetical protein [bacterium]